MYCTCSLNNLALYGGLCVARPVQTDKVAKVAVNNAIANPCPAGYFFDLAGEIQQDWACCVSCPGGSKMCNGKCFCACHADVDVESLFLATRVDRHTNVCPQYCSASKTCRS
jgi:hypothetical protein